MIAFAPAKINLGLRIIGKRPDGFHQIETGMMEVPFFDIIEIVKSDEFQFVQSGIAIGGDSKDNLCTRAYEFLQNEYGIPNVRIHLRKQIPIGAGLGGGSSDAVTVIKMLIDLFQLKLSANEIEEISAELGSDCAFFVRGGLQLATGRGELLTNINVNSIPKYLVLMNPGIHISTKEAYSNVSYSNDSASLKEVLSMPPENWENCLKNDFEEHIFNKHPQIKELKTKLYELGAVYAAMSGSGSSVFGLFNEPVVLSNDLNHCLVCSSYL